jgi:hypothetical protein
MIHSRDYYCTVLLYSTVPSILKELAWKELENRLGSRLSARGSRPVVPTEREQTQRERPTMRSSRLIIRTTAALLRDPRCITPCSVKFQYACRRPFSDEKKADNMTTITFTTKHAERNHTEEHAATLDRSEFTHEVPIRMPDMGEGKCKNR